MPLPEQRRAGDTVLRRRLIATALIGLICALIVFAGGHLLERVVLGVDDDDARARIEADVRSSFERMALRLRDMTAAVAEPDTFRDAASGNAGAGRRLFDRAAASIAGADAAELALTAYAPDGRPLAWAGRPSELPSSRVTGIETWFVTPGALGLRLVYVRPVVTSGDERLGSIIAERALDTPLSVRLAPVGIELPFQNPDAESDTSIFPVRAPSDQPLLAARADADGIARARARWRRATSSVTWMVLAIALVFLTAPLLDARHTLAHGHPRPALAYTWLLLRVAAVVIVARVLLRLASPADWLDLPLFSGAAYASTLLRPLFTSPFDFLLTACTAGALASLLLFGVEAVRLRQAHARRRLDGLTARMTHAVVQLAAGMGVAAVLLGHRALLTDTITNTTIDLLHLSLHPWDPPRVALQVGTIVWHATVLAIAVLLLRLAGFWWCVPRRDWRTRLLTVLLWTLPLIAWHLGRESTAPLRAPLMTALLATVGIALVATRLKQRYRHGSQAFRLTMTTFGLVVPALAFYSTVFSLGRDAKAQLVETRYAPQAVNQRQTIQVLLQQSQEEIDAFPGLADLVTTPAPADEGLTDRAFQVWRVTSLASYPATSSVELYGRDRALVSRFAFNLPDDLSVPPRSEETTCDWEVFEEVAPFFAEERRVLHAGRALCAPDGSILGSVVVHSILDYANLPFIASQSPYLELLRPLDPLRGEGVAGRDVEFALYGWSRQPLFASSGRAWPLENEVFAAVERTRTPFWARLERGTQQFEAFLLNDRGGIYVLAFPVVDLLAHLVNLAELTVLAWLTYLILLTAVAIFNRVSQRQVTGPSLLREIRASFYRKLLLAFIAATVVPVVALAVATGTYVADQMRSNVEQEAVRTSSAARRVVEDLVAPRAAQQGVGVDDNLMVWVSRLIDQDVNLFVGPRLLATSERNLFASGLLPTRTPAEIYRDIELSREAAAVTREQVGSLEYLLAASAMSARQLNAVLTVPLTSRQQEIEGQIDTLYRQVLLGVLIFVFCGAGIGYWLAERIADPVSRLTSATRRLARGDLDVRVALTSSDELRRLVDAFNRMAADLLRQRKELERTHRLEAWAEVARQVAHDIKNPLTPIQLNAEHLRRVHADRGEPLGPVVQECVATILQQVTLLRQIASEFSSFASSPTARPTTIDVGALLRELVAPYRSGLLERIDFFVDVPDALPLVSADRSLVTRALTNIVENALHAMPARGTLTVWARGEDDVVRARISDTGVGIDAEALARAFEPYFSTKAAGTGLGLPIAKRNIELSGGTITLQSERDRGTSVELTLPLA